MPAGYERPVRILGHMRPMCCAGCEAVARTIVESGFESYYETRDPLSGYEALPVDLPPLAVFDDPSAQRQFVAFVGAYEREAMLALDGIRCAACVWLNERFLRRAPGVSSVSVNYVTRRAQIAWDNRVTTLGQIIGAVRALGYDAYPFEPEKQRLRNAAEDRAGLWRLFVAGFGAMQVMMYAAPRYLDDTGTLSAESEQIMRWASLFLTAPVIAFSCGPFFSSALADLRARRLGIDVPVSLGILAGFAASAWATLASSGEVYFDSITMLVLLLLGARRLETSARRKASASLDRLARWMPSFAFRLNGFFGAEGERVAAHELRAEDRVLVAPGEIVPGDGLVIDGRSSVDESLLTGESTPVVKREGSCLIGGSINVDQPLVMQVTRVGTQTQAAAIGRLIERAAAGKPRLVEAADRVAGALTWIVLAAAALTCVGWLALEPSRAAWVTIAVLMVACPCALGLAAPIALTGATGALARRGIILTRGSAIESLAAITDIVVDKTGTLTEAKLSLVNLDLLGSLDRDACLALARALEAGSAHPIATALTAIPVAGVVRVVQQVIHFAGGGVEALVDGRRVRIGSHRFVTELAGPPPSLSARPSSESQVYLGFDPGFDPEFDPGFDAGFDPEIDSGWIARFCLADSLRPDALALIVGLRTQGLEVHLLSGDDQSVVDEVAAQLGFAHAQGGASPQAKHDYVKGLQRAGRRVAMLGDGLNDAPVLAQADVSIAMGQGATLAQQHADLVLLSGKLSGVFEARRIARLTLAAIRQNFGWALAYNAVAVPAAAFGLIGPWEAAVGMAASSLVVVLNSARLLAALR